MAPVSVATSTRCVAPSCRAYQRPSPRIRRPSASVLITSTVLPSALFRTSPGLIARPPGMFSVVGTTPMTRIGAFKQRDRAHGAGDGRAAGHVVLHPLHAVGGLDRDAAGVERDALADQTEHRAPPARPADRGETPSAAAARCCRARRRAAGPCRAIRSAVSSSTSTSARVAGDDRLGAPCELSRRERIAGLVRQLAREVAALAEHPAARDRRRARLRSAPTTVHSWRRAGRHVAGLVAPDVEFRQREAFCDRLSDLCGDRRLSRATRTTKAARPTRRCFIARPAATATFRATSPLNSAARPDPTSATRCACHDASVTAAMNNSYRRVQTALSSRARARARRPSPRRTPATADALSLVEPRHDEDLGVDVSEGALHVDHPSIIP